MVDYAKFVVIFAAAASMAVAAWRHKEWRGGLMLLSALFMAASMNELEAPLSHVFPGLKEPEMPCVMAFLAIGVALAIMNRGTTYIGLKAVYDNRWFWLLVFGLCAVSFMPNIAESRVLWEAFSKDNATDSVREIAEHVVEAVGYVALLLWSVLFLKDKYKVFARRVSPLNHLVFENELVEVGRGTRRVAYRVGDTGYCVKFYIRPEECVKSDMKRSIRKDISWRRFNKFKNSSSQEVHAWAKFHHNMPQEIIDALPPVIERVYHPEWGWGVLETFYTNPDGSAIIPYEFEIQRQTAENRERIYVLARHFLDMMIAHSATFYEPGNFHVLISETGELSLKIIDFEPSSKMAIPLEVVWPWYRRRKLARKSERYMRHLRNAYGIKGGMAGK